jgi:hypothetical protein
MLQLKWQYISFWSYCSTKDKGVTVHAMKATECKTACPNICIHTLQVLGG